MCGSKRVWLSSCFGLKWLIDSGHFGYGLFTRLELRTFFLDNLLEHFREDHKKALLKFRLSQPCTCVGLIGNRVSVRSQNNRRFLVVLKQGKGFGKRAAHLPTQFFLTVPAPPPRILTMWAEGRSPDLRMRKDFSSRGVHGWTLTDIDSEDQKRILRNTLKIGFTFQVIHARDCRRLSAGKAIRNRHTPVLKRQNNVYSGWSGLNGVSCKTLLVQSPK